MSAQPSNGYEWNGSRHQIYFPTDPKRDLTLILEICATSHLGCVYWTPIRTEHEHRRSYLAACNAVRMLWRGKDQIVRVSFHIFVKTIHCLHVFCRNVTVATVRVFNDPLLSETLEKRYVSFWGDQRTSSCPGVQEYFVARKTTTGCSIRKARTKGAYTSTTTSCSRQKSQISVLVLKGYTSI